MMKIRSSVRYLNPLQNKLSLSRYALWSLLLTLSLHGPLQAETPTNDSPRPPVTFKKGEVPASKEHPVGMKTIKSEADTYKASYLPDVIYQTYGDRTLKLQMLTPFAMGSPDANTDNNKRYPLIVFIQGSGWGPQRLYSAIPQLADFAHRGYVVASVEYRHSQEAQLPAQIQDVKSAIRFLRANAKKYAIDPTRVGIWGDSSGGHLAALTGTSDGVSAFLTPDNADQSSSVEAVVDFYGAHDLATLGDFPSRLNHNMPQSPGSLAIGGPVQQNLDKTRQFNPATYITRDKKLPPFLLMHGDKDEIVPFNQSVVLYTALRDVGADVTFYNVKGAGHGIRFWTPSVLKIVHQFFDKHLK